MHNFIDSVSLYYCLLPKLKPPAKAGGYLDYLPDGGGGGGGG